MIDTTSESMPGFASLLKWVRVIAICGAAMFVAGALAVLAVRQESNDRTAANRDLIAQQTADRTAARTTACQQDNVFRKAHNDLVRKDEETLRQIAQSSTNPDVLAFIDQRIADYETDVLPTRRCDPAGIADYYANPQGPNAYEPGV